MPRFEPGSWAGRAPWLALALIALGLLWYSQTLASYVDEPFHLVAAQLVLAGGRPYLDFFYQHPPLYPLLAASWMAAFGQSWRSAHALSALLSVLTVLLGALSVRKHLEGSDAKTCGTLAAVLWLGLHSMLVRQGTVGHPFALAMICSLAAYYCALSRRSFAAGLFSGAAAATFLLWAPVPAILLVWLLREAAGRRLRTALRFFSGFAVAWAPVMRLASSDPGSVWFNLIEYHLVHRQKFAREAGMAQNLKVFLWLPASSQGVFLLILSAAGVLAAAVRRAPKRGELYLAASLAAALWVYTASVRPTFFYYLAPAVPFLAVAAAIGFCALLPDLQGRIAPLALVLVLTALYVFGPLRYGVRHREYVWQFRDRVTREVNPLIPAGAAVYGPEWFYFTSRRLPPPGLHNYFARAVDVEPERRARLWLVSEEQVERQLREGRFDAVLIGGPRARKLQEMYRRSLYLDPYTFFWDRAFPPPVR